MIKTKKDLLKVLEKYSDETIVTILFECTETNTQYDVAILDIAGTEDHIRLCHESDYEGHYSNVKRLQNEKRRLEVVKDDTTSKR